MSDPADSQGDVSAAQEVQGAGERPTSESSGEDRGDSDISASQEASAPSLHDRGAKSHESHCAPSKLPGSRKLEPAEMQPGWLSVWCKGLGALVFSFVCLAANVSILWALEGKGLQSWRLGNVDVTPNALVSIVSTLSKSSLLLPVAEGISQMKRRKQVSSGTCHPVLTDWFQHTSSEYPIAFSSSNCLITPVEVL
jgi:hypothetical protein